MIFSTIKQRRLERGLLQYQLAAATKINPVRLSQIENLRVSPSPREREAIARALKLPENEVFRDGPAVESRAAPCR